MPRHELTALELLRGAEKALHSKKTPRQLRPGIRKLRDRLRNQVAAEKTKDDNGGRGLFGLGR
jgi:hypothetical protein